MRIFIIIFGNFFVARGCLETVCGIKYQNLGLLRQQYTSTFRRQML